MRLYRTIRQADGPAMRAVKAAISTPTRPRTGPPAAVIRGVGSLATAAPIRGLAEFFHAEVVPALTRRRGECRRAYVSHV